MQVCSPFCVVPRKGPFNPAISTLWKLALTLMVGCFPTGVTSGKVDGVALEAKPVALVGDSYGRHDVRSIQRNIFDREDWHFEERGGFLSPEEFGDYSMVVIAHSQERPFTTEEHGLIKQYLEKGGNLLLLNQAPRRIVDEESKEAGREWMGFDAERIKPIDPANAHISEDPILKDVAEEDGPRPSWIGGEFGARQWDPDVEVLLGGESGALALHRRVGDGSVYFLGSELFRLRLPSSPHQPDSGSYVRLIRNILAAHEPLTLADWHAAQAAALRSAGKRFLLWNREWQRGTEDRPIFLPPLPHEGELIGSLDVDLAVDESEAIQVNFTDLGKGGLLGWKVDLGGLPATALNLYVQDRPDPIPWPKDPSLVKESPFWLMPPESVDPKGQESVRIESGQTRIFWLKWNSHGLRPGTYRGAIRFSVDGSDAGMLELNVTVHPVRVPARRAITLQPFGHVYGDVNKPEPALRFKRNLRDHGFEWSLINTLRPETFQVAGEPLTARFVRDHLAEITSESPPIIDFSSMDGFVDAALEHNLTYFRATQNVTESINALCARAKLPEEDSSAVRHWYLREFARYMSDKGIRYLAVSMGDEMHADQLRDRFLPWSRDLAAAGLGATSSFSTSAVADPELTRSLAENVSAWTLNRQHIPKFMAWVRDGTIQLPEGTLVGTYGAGEGRGTEIRKNASASRMIGWEAWAHGSDYCAPNPYFKSWIYYTDYSLDRGLGGERFVSFLDPDDLDAPLVNSPFIEGMRESIEEANLAWAMNWYLQKLGDRVPEALQSRVSQLVGHGEGFLLPWKERSDGEPGHAIEATREAYLQSKREVLEILAELQPLAAEAGLVPDVFWNRIPLILDGRPVVQLAGDESATAPIQAALQNLGGRVLPKVRESFPPDGAVILVGTPGDAHVPEGVKLGLGPHGAEASWIREIPMDDRLVLWVGGTDDRQVEKAVHRFVRFLRAPAAVFVD
jgi:hypothetical protein